uniref:Uncharacterized protein n=1 Tax=Arundo donax TaxID=35708 RepID=A0A0A9API0_ARUDO
MRYMKKNSEMLYDYVCAQLERNCVALKSRM